MDLPTIPSREYYIRWAAILAERLKAARKELDDALDAQAQCTKEWWDWEQTRKEPRV